MKRIRIFLLFILLSVSASATNPSYTCDIANVNYAHNDSIVFRVRIINTGTDTFSVAQFNSLIGFDYANIANNGTVTFSYITGSATASLPAAQKIPTTNISSEVKLTSMIASVASGTAHAIIPNDSVSWSYYLKNTVPFDTNITPDLQLLFVYPTSTIVTKLWVYRNTATTTTNITTQSFSYAFNPVVGGSGGGVPTSRTLTINGVSQDLSANRTWTVATPPVYPSTQLVFGDGSTAGGTTSNRLTFSSDLSMTDALGGGSTLLQVGSGLDNGVFNNLDFSGIPFGLKLDNTSTANGEFLITTTNSGTPVTWGWPLTDASGFLHSNGSGVLSFTTPTTPPIYPNTRIPFGNGSTAGGITNSGLFYNTATGSAGVLFNAGTTGLLIDSTNGIVSIGIGNGTPTFPSLGYGKTVGARIISPNGIELDGVTRIDSTLKLRALANGSSHLLGIRADSTVIDTTISAGAGSVTSIATTAPITGGTITTTGTIGLNKTGIDSVGTLIKGAIGTGFTAIPNSALSNSSVTINGNPVSLGGSTTITANTTDTLKAGTAIKMTSFHGQKDTVNCDTTFYANSTNSGFLKNTDWNTFNSKGAGSVTSIATGVGLTGGTITSSGTIKSDTTDYATASQTGYLKYADWTTFNNKGSGTVTGVTSANGAATITPASPNPVVTINSAPKWTTARALAGNSTDGSANVPFSNNFIVQGTTDAGLTGAQFMGALATGIVKNTTTTGVLSIATSGDFPTLPYWGTTGTASTTSGTNYQGTSDAQGVSYRTNNHEWIHADSLTIPRVKLLSDTVTIGKINRKFVVDFDTTIAGFTTNITGMGAIDILAKHDTGMVSAVNNLAFDYAVASRYTKRMGGNYYHDFVDYSYGFAIGGEGGFWGTGLSPFNGQVGGDTTSIGTNPSHGTCIAWQDSSQQVLLRGNASINATTNLFQSGNLTWDNVNGQFLAVPISLNHLTLFASDGLGSAGAMDEGGYFEYLGGLQGSGVVYYGKRAGATPAVIVSGVGVDMYDSTYWMGDKANVANGTLFSINDKNGQTNYTLNKLSTGIVTSTAGVLGTQTNGVWTGIVIDSITSLVGGTATLTAHKSNIIVASGAITSATITLPSSPVAGDIVGLTTTQTIGTLTYAGGTVVGATITSVPVGATRLEYFATRGVWYQW